MRYEPMRKSPTRKLAYVFQFPQKINFDKRHADTNFNLKKTQTSGALSKVKEIHEEETSVELDRV